MNFLKGGFALGANCISLLILIIMFFWVYISLIAGNKYADPMSESLIATCVTFILPLILYSTAERCFGTDCKFPVNMYHIHNMQQPLAE